MFVDARQIPDDTIVRSDVCVVGAGPAGLTVAEELSEGGLGVCVLESGSGSGEPEGATQDLATAENIGLPYYPLDANRVRAFGGTLGLWAGWCRPLDDLDLERRPWVPESGWPLARAELQRYYARAHERLGLGGVQYDTTRHEAGLGARRIPLDGSRLETRLYHLADPDHLPRASRRRLETLANVTVHLHATATEVELGASARSVARLHVRSLEGRRFAVEARWYVLAGGGVENARLLLASNRGQPDGIGNGHGLVGRYFMEHLHFEFGLIRLDDPRVVSPRLYFRGWGNVVGRVFPTPALQASQRILNCNVMLSPVYTGLASRLRAAVLRRTTAFRRGAGMEKPRPARVVRLAHTLEQAPNPESRVRLGRERDALGMPRVQMDWRTTPLDEHTARRLPALMGEEFRRAGVGTPAIADQDDERAWPPPPLQGMRGHHMGTTRMDPDPRKGVVDEHCRVHGVANLFVAGSSVFPTSGAGTPTITIVALALRLAERIASAHERGA